MHTISNVQHSRHSRRQGSHAQEKQSTHDQAQNDRPQDTAPKSAIPALDGPYYDDLTVGYVFPKLPSTSIGEAENLQYRMITGNEHRLTADRSLYRSVSESEGTLANPGLVLQLSIGQSTSATRKAIANLFYRGVLLQRTVETGEQIETTTAVLGLNDSRPKDGGNRGKVLLGIWTVGENGPIAQYERCALLPCRQDLPGHIDPLGSARSGPSPDFTQAIPSHWDLSNLAELDWSVGETKTDIMWDHIDMAPALARMTFNQAIVHRSALESAYGKRLVYGGHVIGLAEASLTRLLPGMATILGWGQCNHLGPAFEGDTLSFEHTLVSKEASASGQILRLRTTGYRQDESNETDTARLTATPILDWESVIYHR